MRVIDNAATGDAIIDLGNNSESGFYAPSVVRLNANGNSYLTGGNVGIGTTGPTTKLQVSVSTANDGISIVSNGILSGQSTEVTGQLTNFEYNYNRLGAQNTTYVGGAFTIDSRTPATTLFHWRYRSTAGVESEVMDLGSTGNLSIPGAFSASQLNVISAGVASYFQGGAGGYSALSFSGDSGTTVASLTTLSGAILIGSRNAGGTGSNGEIAIKSGSVGIGTTAPSATYKLDVVGLARFSTDIHVGGQVIVGSGDLAEDFYTDKIYPAGTVLVMDNNGYKSARACDKKYDTTVIGVISENPGLVIGQLDGKYKAPIALTGVIKVRVNSSGGQIHQGDLLTTSAISGEAMKATDPKIGTCIGKALENDNGKGYVMAIVNLK